MPATVEEFFSELPTKFRPEKAEGVDATFLMNIDGDGGGEWTIKVLNQKIDITLGAPDNPNLTVATSAETWLDIVNKKLDPQTAFFSGKLKISGDMGLAMRMPSLFLT